MTINDVTPMIDGISDKPRDANLAECEYYLRWLARCRGVVVPVDAKFRPEGIVAGCPAAIVLEMPGYGQSQAVTCELLDDAGEVIKTMILPPKANGSLPMDKAQAKAWTGLTTVRKVRGKAAAAPVVETPAPIAETVPVAAPTVETVAPASPDVAAVVAALEARIAALEAGRTVSALPAAANDVDVPARRTAREEAAIRRAWAMRCAMRERADLDRRALEATNGAYRGLLDQYAEARAIADSVKNDRDALDVMLTAARAQISAADRANATLRQQVRDTGRRADRLVTIATAKRRAAAGDRAALLRVQSDLAGAQAETRAVQRRFATLKDAVASSPAAAAVVTRKMPVNALAEG
jgi:hypothetical protein